MPLHFKLSWSQISLQSLKIGEVHLTSWVFFHLRYHGFESRPKNNKNATSNRQSLVSKPNAPYWYFMTSRPLFLFNTIQTFYKNSPMSGFVPMRTSCVRSDHSANRATTATKILSLFDHWYNHSLHKIVFTCISIISSNIMQDNQNWIRWRGKKCRLSFRKTGFTSWSIHLWRWTWQWISTKAGITCSRKCLTDWDNKDGGSLVGEVWPDWEILKLIGDNFSYKSCLRIWWFLGSFEKHIFEVKTALAKKGYFLFKHLAALSGSKPSFVYHFFCQFWYNIKVRKIKIKNKQEVGF